LLLSSLLLIALMQPIAGAAFVLDGVLIGAGDNRYLAVAQTIAMVAFLPAAWLIFTLGGGLVALWAAITVWLAVRLITLAVRSHGSAWMVTGV
jgi:Na+-driven multidrug efflux pump